MQRLILLPYWVYWRHTFCSSSSTEASCGTSSLRPRGAARERGRSSWSWPSFSFEAQTGFQWPLERL